MEEGRFGKAPRLTGGPAVRISLPPPLSPSLRGPADAGGQSRGCGARLGLVRDVRKGRAGYDQTSFGPVSLTGIDAVPLQQSSTRSQRRGGRGEGRGLRHTFWLCGSACEQFALLGPVQRQIEFGQTRRGERDGLPALQDRLDQLRAQEGEANETANVAPANAVTFSQFLE